MGRGRPKVAAPMENMGAPIFLPQKAEGHGLHGHVGFPSPPQPGAGHIIELVVVSDVDMGP